MDDAPDVDDGTEVEDDADDVESDDGKDTETGVKDAILRAVMARDDSPIDYVFTKAGKSELVL